MKNEDLPAKPILKASKEQGDVVSHEYEGGLTKREDIAAKGSWTQKELKQVAQTIADELNHDEKRFDEYVNSEDPQILMKARVRLADALLTELEE